MKTLYFETPPPCLSLILSLSLSLNRIRARKEEEFYKKSFLFRGEKSQAKWRPNAPKSSFFLSLFCVVCLCLFSFSRGVLSRCIHSLHFSMHSYLRRNTRDTQHTRHHQLENHIRHTQDNRERYRERKIHAQHTCRRFVAVTLFHLPPLRLPPGGRE